MTACLSPFPCSHRPILVLWTRQRTLVALASIAVACLLSLFVLIPRPALAAESTASEWQPQAEPVSPSAPVSFHWLFPHRQLSWLQQQFDERTNPRHPHYLHWLSNDEVLSRIGPPAEDKQAVLNWLAAAGIRELAAGSSSYGRGVRDYGDGLEVRSDAATVQRLFDVQLQRFVHTESGLSAFRSRHEPRIPSELQHALHSIRGLGNFPPPRSMRRERSEAPSPSAARPPAESPAARRLQQTAAQVNVQCPTLYDSPYYYGISPAFLEQQYNVTSRSNSTQPSAASASVVGGFDSSQGVDAFLQSDLTHFQGNIAYAAPFIANVINSSNNDAELQTLDYDVSDEAIEGSLDIQALFFFSPTTNNSFYSAQPLDGPYEVSLAYLSMPDAQRPQVLSFSFFWDASDLAYNSADQGRTDVNWMRLGLLGTTVMVCAGDDGTAGWQNPDCISDPNSLFTSQVSNTAGPMLPQYPASSPVVLSVGETGFMQGPFVFSQAVSSPPQCNNCPQPNPREPSYPIWCQEVSGGEEVVSRSNAYAQYSQTSGGGFSSYAARPAWQQAAVTAYLNVSCGFNNSNGCALPPASYYNSGNRAYPDISIFGAYFPFVLNGVEWTAIGTSVSTPLLAGLVGRLNEVAIARTGRSLGFINPLLYQMAADDPTIFHDLTTGNNPCTQDVDYCPGLCSGFQASAGWDPVTGLGSPNFGKMLAYLEAMLPPPGSSTGSAAQSAASSSSQTSSASASTSAPTLPLTALSSAASPSPSSSSFSPSSAFSFTSSSPLPSPMPTSSSSSSRPPSSGSGSSAASSSASLEASTATPSSSALTSSPASSTLQPLSQSSSTLTVTSRTTTTTSSSSSSSSSSALSSSSSLPRLVTSSSSHQSFAHLPTLMMLACCLLLLSTL